MRKAILQVAATPPVGPYSQAIKAGGFVFVAGQIPIDAATRLPVEGGIAKQTAYVLDSVAAILEAAGSGLDKAVRCVVYLRSMDDFPAMNEAYAPYFRTDPPARTTVEVSRLPRDCLIEIEATALV